MGATANGKNLGSKFFSLRVAPYKKEDKYFHVSVISLGGISVALDQKLFSHSGVPKSLFNIKILMTRPRGATDEHIDII